MSPPPWPQRLYRIVRTDPPSRDDFLSNWVVRERDIAAGRRPRSVPADGEALHMWSGISTYDSVAAAREQARRYRLGGFIATLEIPPGIGIRVEQTSRRADHYTLWGEPGTLLATVAEIQPV